MRKIETASIVALFLVSALAAGCRTPSIRGAAPRGAAAILDQLEALGEERAIALEGDIRGSAHPPCSMTEVFLKAQGKRKRRNIRLVERNLLNLIRDEYEFSRKDLCDEETLVRLGDLLQADTVVIGWGRENEEKAFRKNPATGERVLHESHWYTTYLHMVAIDVSTGRVIASWSYHSRASSQVSGKVCPWIRDGDVVVIQPTLDDEIKSALLAGLHKGSGGRYQVVVRDLVRLLAREARRQSSDFFSSSNQDLLKISGAGVIVGADSAMGLNLRAIDVRSGEIIGGLPGPLSEHIKTFDDSPRMFSL